jgi:MYXO-CTERM domain-containing protein
MKQPSAKIKMLRSRREKINSIEQKRWAAYASAVLASGFTFSVAESAEAEIHYSGLIHQEVPFGSCYFYNFHYLFRCYDGIITLPLRNEGVIKAHHRPFVSCYARCYTYGSGSAFLAISAPGAAVRGAVTGNGLGSISRLLPGDLVSAGPFERGNFGFLAERCYSQHYECHTAAGQFQALGQGFAGFKFNNGAGEQYGWIRVRMGGAPGNTFGVVDYAYGDPGEVVRAGQKMSHSSPGLESLGGLALGAAGLLAWRRRRANQRAAA